MNTLRTTAADMADLAEDLLTSPDLSASEDLARNNLLEAFYSDGLTSRSLYDIVSLTKHGFRKQLEDIRDAEVFSFTAYPDLARDMYLACRSLGSYLQLDLDKALEEQRSQTIYGASRLDGIANVLVVVGSDSIQ